MFYWVAKYTLGVALKIVFRPWSRGRSNMPRRGPVILVSNHLSFADHFFVATPLKNARLARPLMPLPVKYSALARNTTLRGSGSGPKK